MMDIVEKLRARPKANAPHWAMQMFEAADEIESLRQQLAECERERDEHLRSWNRVVEERIAVTKERDELVAALEGLSYWAQPRKTDKPELCGFEGKQGDKNFDAAAKALAKVGADKTGEKTPQVDAHWPKIRMDISEGVCGTCKLGAKNCDVDLDGHCGGVK